MTEMTCDTCYYQRLDAASLETVCGNGKIKRLGISVRGIGGCTWWTSMRTVTCPVCQEEQNIPVANPYISLYEWKCAKCQMNIIFKKH